MLVNNRHKVVLTLNASILNLQIDCTIAGGCQASTAWKSICPRNTRKDAKISEAKIDGFTFPWQQTLIFHSRIMAKVHEQTWLAARCGKVVQHLCPVFINQLGDRFDLKDDLVVANEIRSKCLPKCDRGIATFAAALREMESVGIPTRFPDTRDKSARGNRSLCPYRLESTPRQWRSSHPCKLIPLFFLFVSFRVFRGLEE
jgi:hypothetical protein